MPPAAPTLRPVNAARRNLSWRPRRRPLRAEMANVGREKNAVPKMREGSRSGGLGSVSTSSWDVIDRPGEGTAKVGDRQKKNQRDIRSFCSLRHCVELRFQWFKPG